MNFSDQVEGTNDHKFFLRELIEYKLADDSLLEKRSVLPIYLSNFEHSPFPPPHLCIPEIFVATS
jgi:hypothetical protein